MSFKKRVLLFIILFLLFAVLLNLRQNRPLYSIPRVTLIEQIAVSLYVPIHKVINIVTDAVKQSWSNYFALIGAKKENQRLKEEISLKDLYIMTLKERLKLQDRTRYLNHKINLLGWDGVTGEVIGYDPYSESQTLWLSVGSKKGIKVDQPVITLEGLAGRVVKVLPESSQVLLMVDPRFAVDVIDESSRVRALVVGSGKKASLKRYPYLTHLEYLNLGDEVNQGDLLITSGLGGIYPRGIPVGNVTDAEKDRDDLFQTSAVLPVVDFNKLEELIILTRIDSYD